MAESVFGKPIDNAIQEINDKIGTVPSGETVEGQISELNGNLEISNLYSGEDLNTKFGYNGLRVFYVGSGVSNSPQDYATLLVISREGDGLATQLSIGNDVYARIRIGSPLSWSAWKKLN